MRTQSIRRQCSRTFIAPTASTPSVNKTVRNIIGVSPFSLGFSNTINCYISARTPISHLLTFCCPSHISNFVMPIVVDAVKRVFRRGFSTNMVNKFLKRCKTELNSPFAVMMIDGISRIRATTLSAYISVILDTMGRSKSWDVFQNSFAVQATAGLGSTLYQGRTAYDGFAATNTLAIPIRVSINATCVGDNG